MTKSDIFIEKLRERLSIVDIIGKKVNWDYKKSNVRSGTYWACCPFHTEKTASFKVDENKDFTTVLDVMKKEILLRSL